MSKIIINGLQQKIDELVNIKLKLEDKVLKYKKAYESLIEHLDSTDFEKFKKNIKDQTKKENE